MYVFRNLFFSFRLRHYKQCGVVRAFHQRFPSCNTFRYCHFISGAGPCLSSGPGAGNRSAERMAIANVPIPGPSARVEAMALPRAPLPMMLEWMDKKEFKRVAEYFESNFAPQRQSLLDFCVNPCHARDVVLMLMRTFTALGRMQDVRRLFVIALRDLAAPDVVECRRGCNSRSGLPVTCQTRPSMLNASVFNAYLEVLTQRKNFDREEVLFVLNAMKKAGVLRDALTYHYLIELHVRAGLDPKGLWNELVHKQQLEPLPCTLLVLVLRVIPSSPDSVFVMEVTRFALKHGSAVMDKSLLAERIVQLLRSTQSEPAVAVAEPSSSIAEGARASPRSLATSAVYPPECVMWLILELEVRCVLDKVSFTQYMQHHHVAELLLRCAKNANAITAAQVLALMDRHMMPRTEDLLALVVWCWAEALELEKALDVVELMARKGYFSFVDPFKRYCVDCLRYTMDRHFLVILADAINSIPLLDRVLAHLNERKRQGEVVSVHALDVVVLAACSIGEERRAMELVFSYDLVWGVRPQTNTLNCLLMGSSTQRGSVLLRTLYEAMIKAGVVPNALTFRVLIRQAVLHDSIDEAVYFLQEVTRHTGLRVEVEMILPILERAARAGDVETVNRISKYSLDCDIGIDGAVLQTCMKNLVDAGQDVEVLKGHQPLHEALRSRSKAGRQRARSEILL